MDPMFYLNTEFLVLTPGTSIKDYTEDRSKNWLSVILLLTELARLDLLLQLVLCSINVWPLLKASVALALSASVHFFT